MTPQETARHHAEIELAFANGAEIESIYNHRKDVWTFNPCPDWNWQDFDFRVRDKPKPKRKVKLLAWFSGESLYHRAEGLTCPILTLKARLKND